MRLLQLDESLLCWFTLPSLCGEHTNFGYYKKSCGKNTRTIDFHNQQCGPSNWKYLVAKRPYGNSLCNLHFFFPHCLSQRLEIL